MFSARCFASAPAGTPLDTWASSRSASSFSPCYRRFSAAKGPMSGAAAQRQRSRGARRAQAPEPARPRRQPRGRGFRFQVTAAAAAFRFTSEASGARRGPGGVELRVNSKCIWGSGSRHQGHCTDTSNRISYIDPPGPLKTSR